MTRGLPVPNIPPIDSAFFAEIRTLTEEASAARQQVAALAERVGKVTDRFDEMTEDLDDNGIDHLR